VEGVEVDLDIVVGADAVAVGQRVRDGAVRLEGANAEVDRGGRVPDEDVGGVGRGALVGRLVLREAGEERRPAPGGLVEPPIDGGIRFDPGWRDGRLARSTVIDGGRRGRELERGGENREDVSRG